MMTVLRISELSIQRGTAIPVLGGINLSVPRGQILGLVGESGSGKTTLANAVLGILPAGFRVTCGAISSGEGQLAGVANPARNAKIAYVPQDPSTAMDPLFTIGVQVDDILRIRRTDLRTRRDRSACAAEHLAAVGLPDAVELLRRRPHEVSGGQRQRLTLAIALMTYPDLIVADEPTTALDLTTQARILALIRRLVDDSGAGVLLTTHDLGVAHEVCDRVAVMYRGRIVEEAATASLLQQPKHPYTRRLIAAHRPGMSDMTPSFRPPEAGSSGCRYHPACSQSRSICATDEPQPRQMDDHLVACWQAAMP